jgi:hypothetical protein
MTIAIIQNCSLVQPFLLNIEAGVDSFVIYCVEEDTQEDSNAEGGLQSERVK